MRTTKLLYYETKFQTNRSGHFGVHFLIFDSQNRYISSSLNRLFTKGTCVTVPQKDLTVVSVSTFPRSLVGRPHTITPGPASVDKRYNEGELLKESPRPDPTSLTPNHGVGGTYTGHWNYCSRVYPK